MAHPHPDAVCVKQTFYRVQDGNREDVHQFECHPSYLAASKEVRT
jgi:hypothetical protein